MSTTSKKFSNTLSCIKDYSKLSKMLTILENHKDKREDKKIVPFVIEEYGKNRGIISQSS